jgi:hypothetical protein
VFEFSDSMASTASSRLLLLVAANSIAFSLMSGKIIRSLLFVSDSYLVLFEFSG